MTSSMIGPMIGTRTRCSTSPAGSNAFAIPLPTSTRIFSSTPGAPSLAQTQNASRIAKANGSNADVTLTTATSGRNRAGMVAVRRRSTAPRNGGITAIARRNIANGVAFVTTAVACPDVPSKSVMPRLRGTARSNRAKVKNAICIPEAVPTFITPPRREPLLGGSPSALLRHPLDHVRREIDHRLVRGLQLVEGRDVVVHAAIPAADLRDLLLAENSLGNLRYRSVTHVTFLSAIVGCLLRRGVEHDGSHGVGGIRIVGGREPRIRDASVVPVLAARDVGRDLLRNFLHV